MRTPISLQVCALFAGWLFSQLSAADSKCQLKEVMFPKVVLYNGKMTLNAVIVCPQDSDPKQEIKFKVSEGPDLIGAVNRKEGTFEPSSKSFPITLEKGEYARTVQVKDINSSNSVTRKIWLSAYIDGTEIGTKKKEVHGMPGVVTLIPIVVLLAISLFLNQALVALVSGIFLSATFINGFNPLLGFLRMLDLYIIQSLSDTDHTKIAMLTFYLSGMIALIQKSGGAQALANSVTKIATTRSRAQWATYLVGVAIFLDDTASLMIVGSNFQPVTDILFLSREKLAFLVHVTSSPVSSLFPVSSWIGFQVGLINQQLKVIESGEDGFILFIKTLPSRFYPIFMLALTAITILFGREFGPMLTAERRSHLERKVVEDDSSSTSEAIEIDPLEPSPTTPRRWFNAAIPILLTVIVTLISLLLSGYHTLLGEFDEASDEDKRTIKFGVADLAGKGNPYDSLLYAAFGGCVTCIILYRIQGIFTLGQSIETLILGVKDVVESLIVLIFAWAIGDAFKDLGCADFLVSILSSTLPQGLVPSIAFLLACIVSFTTGTSWGTTTIMFPLVIPLVNEIARGDSQLLLLTVSAILAGALFGDQCSPISSTTILCCLSTRTPVKAHVNTQLPYGILVVIVSTLLGYLPTGYKWYPDYAGLLIGLASLIAVLFIIGGRTEIKPGTTSPTLIDHISKLIPRRRSKPPSIMSGGSPLEPISPTSKSASKYSSEFSPVLATSLNH